MILTETLHIAWIRSHPESDAELASQEGGGVINTFPHFINESSTNIE
jgi:hypothetical protein